MELTIKEHKTRDLVKKFSLEESVTALKQAIDLIDYGMKVETAFKEYDNATGDSEDALDDLLSELETIISPAVGIFEDYGLYIESLQDAINKSIKLAFLRKTALDKKLNYLTLAGIAPNEANKEDIMKAIKYIIGCTAYFVCYEFQLYQFAIPSDDGVQEADSAFVSYCNSVGRSDSDAMLEYAQELCELSIVYRISFGVFIDHKELEQPFFDVVGPDANLIDESALTLDLVHAVINGDISVPELMASVSVYTEDGDDDSVKEAGAF